MFATDNANSHLKLRLSQLLLTQY